MARDQDLRSGCRDVVPKRHGNIITRKGQPSGTPMLAATLPMISPSSSAICRAEASVGRALALSSSWNCGSREAAATVFNVFFKTGKKRQK